MNHYQIYLMNERNERVYEKYDVDGNCGAVRAKLEKLLPVCVLADHALIEWGVAEPWGIEVYHAEARIIGGKLDIQVQQW